MKVKLVSRNENTAKAYWEDHGTFEVDGDIAGKPPAGIVRRNGRHYVQTTMNQDLWPGTITYSETTIWEI